MGVNAPNGAKVVADLLLQGRTAIIIAHRLSTAMRADRIVVVTDGGIAETGSHQELLAKAGAYAEMYATWTSHSQRDHGADGYPANDQQ